MKVDTTKMSSRGQVVIPESIRKHLRLKKGDILIVEVTHMDRGAKGILLSRLYEFLRKVE